MLAFHFGQEKLIIDKSQVKLMHKLKDLNFEPFYSEDKLSHKYPQDILLNVALFGNKLFCKRDSISREILSFAEKNKIKIIDVKQGYAKCSIAAVSENAIITTDINIKSNAIKYGMDVLLIRNEGILIDGYNYGFIGGCCGKIDKSVLAFTGNIKLHKDFINIKSFCRNFNVDILSLANKNLIDIGGIIPIEQA